MTTKPKLRHRSEQSLKRRKKEEGRAEVGWNCNGDLNPNAILTPYDGGELNPYLEVKNPMIYKYIYYRNYCKLLLIIYDYVSIYSVVESLSE
ncbi:MAG: hypothetical protein AAF915_22330 [Cyanobacteria bacterium P01_D01_bin.50]